MLDAYDDRLPRQALLMRPLCLLPFGAAYSIYIASNLVAFGVLVRMWLLPRVAVIWGALYLPVAASILLGQAVIVFASCIACATLCLEAKRDWRPGFC